ncbi:MAG: S41 family peptidase [Candidatus Kerfeldbacteria bacterium]|nr:S41 family peptidase [Candidatus Kerfeldbacteria bacterium]
MSDQTNKGNQPNWFLRGVIFLLVIGAMAGCAVGGYVVGVAQQARDINSDGSITLDEVLLSVDRSINGGSVNPQLFEDVWNTITTKYVGTPVDETKLFYGALHGLVAGLDDPYSRFLDPDETTKFNQELSGSFEGIGTEIGIKNDQLTIIAPLPDSPAAHAGLKARDLILAIDGTDTLNMSIDTAVNLIRGPQGTTVVLTIASADSDEPRDVSITRDIITVKSIDWEMLDDGNAYVEITHFDTETDQEFRQIAQEMLLKNPSGLIIDVRNNPGGYLDTVVDLAGQFFAGQEIIVIENSGSERKEYHAEGQGLLTDIPIVVLVNEGSASASEILAGALQDNERATIIGTQTFGKGSVQDYEQFSDGSSLKLTVSKWLTPLGSSIDEEGITPDIVVEQSAEDYNNDRDPQLDRAQEELKK